ncbi:hypothetical protein AGMMS49546_27000 [Spirochaetia bacterium]|nr:hypothetical protein AGMMS49546_27000 [Spirochaetia bacterium]
MKLYPCLLDKHESSGMAKGHYFHQDLLVARRIFINNPNVHIDVGSRFDGFVTHVASFRNIKVLDIRPLSIDISNISFIQCDLMSPLPEEMIESTDSLSCLHALEHFGLGRYGDPINYNGHLLGLNNLYSLLKPKGRLYLSVPIGADRIEFNAHRVFSIEYLLKLFDKKYCIEHFSYIDDAGDLHENVAVTETSINNYECTFGCGVLR